MIAKCEKTKPEPCTKETAVLEMQSQRYGEGQLCDGNNGIIEGGMCFGVVFQYKAGPRKCGNYIWLFLTEYDQKATIVQTDMLHLPF